MAQQTVYYCKDVLHVRVCMHCLYLYVCMYLCV
jgi:hypothetical protein